MKVARSLPRFAAMMALALLVGSCGREAPFLHYYPAVVKPPTQLIKANVKELAPASKVDILWVIDNSGSMSEYQRDVIRGAQRFMSRFVQSKGLDWRIGVRSSDMVDFIDAGFGPTDGINPASADPLAQFQDAVGKLGDWGSGTEMFFNPVLDAFTRFPAFFRNDAALAAIFITDAPEQSLDGPNDTDPDLTAQVFMDRVRAFKGKGSDFYLYAALAAEDFGCSTSEGLVYSTSKYKEVIDATRGKVYTLCDPNFGDSLADLAKDLLQHVFTPRIKLPVRPIVSSIRVAYGDVILKGGPKAEGGVWLFDYATNSVVFNSLDFAVEDTVAVHITYDEDTTPMAGRSSRH
jgi:hypothetical protein